MRKAYEAIVNPTEDRATSLHQAYQCRPKTRALHNTCLPGRILPQNVHIQPHQDLSLSLNSENSDSTRDDGRLSGVSHPMRLTKVAATRSGELYDRINQAQTMLTL
jgi:hypothetical protein